MRVVLQRVSQAQVTIEDKEHAAIGKGLLILLGVEEEDSKEDVDWLVAKIAGMRLFSDENGKMNLSLADTDGDAMVISQFTLMASTRKGNRPSFIKAAKPLSAIPLYDAFVASLSRKLGRPLATGVFGADMQVALTNDGPVTIVMDSKRKE
ncbi:D-aminoacyl-tRNA deacylase [Nonlabens xiamenensis]|uniref:D-aminoacyl-tRNA deacylase n=1 Tax=Nonlabens xiamenensis TaxID=2341043 RepID=UPI000F60DC7E|nr:D-aminoacyl-tRNA deacylase [Nonlabens xiamenensis]